MSLRLEIYIEIIFQISSFCKRSIKKHLIIFNYFYFFIVIFMVAKSVNYTLNKLSSKSSFNVLVSSS